MREKELDEGGKSSWVIGENRITERRDKSSEEKIYVGSSSKVQVILEFNAAMERLIAY